MRSTKLLCLVAFSTFMMACTTAIVDRAIRSWGGDELQVVTFDSVSAQSVGKTPYERITFTHDGRSLSFTVRAVELDDGGVLFEREQIDDVRDAVLSDGEGGGAIIVVFIHGWKHNATPCDDNLACFRQVLQNLTIEEHDRNPNAPRTVSGVYVGWRGLSSCHEPWKELSFWRRKQTAHNVGASQVREVLQNLRDAHEQLNENRHNRAKSRLVIVGHSFGAAMVYSAVASDIRQDFWSATNMPKTERRYQLLPGLVTSSCF